MTRRAGALLFVVALAAHAQLMPPEIILLARVKAHVRQELARLPDCSCLETVRREHKAAGGKMRPLDTIRLEVLASGDRELFASPGDRRFTDKHPASFAGSGVIGDGYFALLLRDVVSEGRVSYDYRGEETVAGRKLARFDFRLSQAMSGYVIHMDDVTATVGMKGSFWADPKLFDILRLEMRADEIPPSLPISESVTVIHYARMRLGEREATMPVSGDYRLTRISGEESHNVMEFTHCRLFGAESSINFGAPAQGGARPAEVVAPESSVERDLPSGLAVTIRLAAPVTDAAAVGEMVEGVVSGAVTLRGRTLIADGAPVRGRVRRMEHHSDPGDYFVVALEFTEIASPDGGRFRFYADLQDLDRVNGVEWQLVDSTSRVRGVETVTTHLTVTFTDLPGVGTFFVRGAKVDLPKGFRTVWRTSSL